VKHRLTEMSAIGSQVAHHLAAFDLEVRFGSRTLDLFHIERCYQATPSERFWLIPIEPGLQWSQSLDRLIPVNFGGQFLDFFSAQYFPHQLKVLQRNNSREVLSVATNNDWPTVGSHLAEYIGIRAGSAGLVDAVRLTKQSFHGHCSILRRLLTMNDTNVGELVS
jgi:hypothetical protein